MNQTTDKNIHGAKHKSKSPAPARRLSRPAPFYPVHGDTPRTRAHPHPGTCGSRPIRVKADKTRSTQPRQPKGQCGRNTPPLKKELAEYQKTPQLQKQLHFRNYLQLKPLFLVGVLHFVQNFVIRALASVHMQLERPVQLRRGQNRRRCKESFYSLKSRLAYRSPVKLHRGLQEIRQRRNNRCITRTETMVKPHHAQDTHHVLFTRGRWVPVNGQSLCPNRTHLSFSPQ